jgi:hypothetical protein
VLYFRSIYWALYTTSSIGYYDILNTNPVETIGITLIMLFGCQIFNSTVGDIASLMGNLDADSKSFKTKVSDMRHVMAWKSFPSALSGKVLSYYDYTWKTTENINEEQVASNNSYRQISLPIMLLFRYIYYALDIGHSPESSEEGRLEARDWLGAE